MLSYLLQTPSSELSTNTESQVLYWFSEPGNNDLAHLDAAYTTPRAGLSFPSRMTHPNFEELWPLKTFKVSNFGKYNQIYTKHLNNLTVISSKQLEDPWLRVGPGPCSPSGCPINVYWPEFNPPTLCKPRDRVTDTISHGHYTACPAVYTQLLTTQHWKIKGQVTLFCSSSCKAKLKYPLLHETVLMPPLLPVRIYHSLNDAKGPQIEQSYHVSDIGHTGRVSDAFFRECACVSWTDKDHPRLWTSYAFGAQSRKKSYPLKREGRKHPRRLPGGGSIWARWENECYAGYRR